MYTYFMDANNPPFFSIVIPSLNEEKSLPQLLISLSCQSDKDFEVIISDCFSKDKTKQKVEEFKTKIPCLNFVAYKSKNVSQARNYGASLAKAKYLIFFDADVTVEPNFIKEIREKIGKYHLDTLTVWNRPKEKTFMPKIILGLLNVSMTLFQKIKPAANGPCMIIKKSVFEEIKGFDDTIVFGEDFDLIQKAWKKGAKFAVFTKPQLFISIRRFEKEGVMLSLYKSIKAIFYQLIFGPIRKPIFDYEMGGQYYNK